MVNQLLMIDLLTGVYWFDDALQTALRKHGWDIVTRSQSLLFANLSSGEYRQSRLAKNLGVTRQAISQMLAELQQRGLIILDVDPNDRRARIVRFSKSSSRLRDAACSVLAQLEARLKQRLGAEVYNTMKKGLATDWGTLPDVDPSLPLPRGKGRRATPGATRKAADRGSTP